MNLLDKLWRPATDIKPEELIGKHLRWKATKVPLIIEYVREFDGMMKIYFDNGIKHYHFNDHKSNIEYLDESPEAVKEMVKPLMDLLHRAKNLVGNPGTNISSGTDFPCSVWQKDYNALTSNSNEHTANK